MLSIIGRFDLDDCNAVCSNCDYKYGDSISSVICAGFWPGNITRSCQYMFSIELFKFYDTLQKFVPGTSMTGFIRTLEHLSSCHGRVKYIILIIMFIPYMVHIWHWLHNMVTCSFIQTGINNKSSYIYESIWRISILSGRIVMLRETPTFWLSCLLWTTALCSRWW